MDNVPVIPMMKVTEIADFLMVSVLDGLLNALLDRNIPKSRRYTRIEAAQNYVLQLAESYEGRIPEELEPINNTVLEGITDYINKSIVATMALNDSAPAENIPQEA